MSAVVEMPYADTFRVPGKPYRYITCQCGRKLHIGRSSHVDDGRVDRAFCSSATCGITVKIIGAPFRVGRSR